LTPPGGSTGAGQVVNQYDTSGRVTQQTESDGSVVTFSYSGNNLTLPGGTTTVVTYPEGMGSGNPSSTNVYSYDDGVLIAEEVGQGSPTDATEYFGRDPISLLSEDTTDLNANESAVSLQSYSGTGGTPTSSANITGSNDGVNSTQASYNSFNQAWCTVDAADTANSVVCPSTAPSSPPAPGTSDPNLGMTINFYNSADQLTATTDALANTTTYAYTTSGSGVPVGLLYCTVDPVDYQKSVTCPAYGSAHVTGTQTTGYDAAGDPTSSTDADGNTTTKAYANPSHPGLVSSETDADGTTTTFTYNAAGQITQQVASFGSYSATTDNAYDSDGRIYCTVSPYEVANSVTCPGTPPTSPPTGTPGYTATIYNSSNEVTSVTNPIGGTTQFAYDGDGNKYCTVTPNNYATGTRCPSSPPSTPPTPTSDPYLGATIDTFNALNQLTQETSPIGGITLYTYDSNGSTIQTTVESNNSTNAPNIVTATTYDNHNRVIATTLGYGSASPATTLTSYDPNGNAFCTVSANAYAQGSTKYQCPIWQPAWITAPPKPSSLYASSPTSAQATNVTTTFLNADRDQVQSTNPDVHTSISTFDGDGRTYCTSDPTNVSAWLTAHSGSTYPYLCPATPPTTPPAQGSNPGYTTIIFDAAGRTLSSTDQVGDTTSYAYDPAGHPTTVTDPRSEVTTSCYYWQNGSGQCAASAPAGGGSADDLYSTTTPDTTADPSGETTTNTYYPGDLADTTATPAGTTTDTYDAQLDLTGTSYSHTASGYATPTNISYTYFPDGTRNTMTDGTGTTTYSEDAADDVTEQQLSATGSGLTSNTVQYGYYSTGVLASVTYPSYTGYSTPSANYTYDALGNMTSVSDWLSNKVTFTHDTDGNLTAQDNAVSTSYPTGTSSTALSYDAADQNTQGVSTLTQTCSGNIETLTQSFSGSTGSRNPDGQVTQDKESYTNSCSSQSSYQRNYSYDVAGRVVYQGTAAQGANANNEAYDPSGDPTTISSHDTSNNFDTYTQVFDAAGEIQSQTPISGSHGVTSTYTYDTLGDLAKTVAGSATSNYGFNQIGQMTSYNPSSATTYQYTGDGLEAATTFPGDAWAAATSIDTTNVIDAVSCVSSLFCQAVDATGNALKYNGTSWSAATSIDTTKVLNGVSCPTTSFCEAVDANGNGMKYNGTSWAAPTSIDGTKNIKAVSCVSSSFCEAVDASGGAVKYNGTTWTASTIDSGKVLDSVSCPTTSFCEAVDANGNAFKYNGSSWSAATSIDGTKVINGVSCFSSSFCEAVDANGNALKYTSSWSAAATVDSTTPINGVTCSSASFCDAVDNTGNVLTFNGTAWSAPGSIDGTKMLHGISCPTSAFCEAVDANGNAVNYGPAQLTSQLTWDRNGTLAQVLSDGTNDYVYGATGEPVEQVNVTPYHSASNPQFMTYTPSNSSWLVTNTAGNELSLYRYDAFGNLALGTPSSPFGYAGQYTDTSSNSSGFGNMRARWYQPQTGEFTTRDPAFSQTDQAYAYAGDDPVNGSDPTGDYPTIGLPAIPACGQYISQYDPNGPGANNASAGVVQCINANVAIAEDQNPPSNVQSPNDFANDLLLWLGVPLTYDNVVAIYSWEQFEGGNWKDYVGSLNPLNIIPNGYKKPKYYPSWSASLGATSFTLSQYPSIYVNLLEANPVSDTISRIAANGQTFGTKNIGVYKGAYANNGVPLGFAPPSVESSASTWQATTTAYWPGSPCSSGGTPPGETWT